MSEKVLIKERSRSYVERKRHSAVKVAKSKCL
jgi:hypothetical protein